MKILQILSIFKLKRDEDQAELKLYLQPADPQSLLSLKIDKICKIFIQRKG